MSWLNTAIVHSPIGYKLVLTERALKKATKKMVSGLDLEFPQDGACVHTFEIDGVNSHAIVCLSERVQSDSIEEIYVALVHEATHIKQNIMQVIGESNPSPEFEAYTVQNISHTLFKEYKRQTKGKK